MYLNFDGLNVSTESNTNIDINEFATETTLENDNVYILHNLTK